MFPAVNNFIVCRICLHSGENVREMNYEDVKLYKCIHVKITVCTETSYICIYCKHLLKKFHKFYHQCLIANEYMGQTVTADMKMPAKILDLQICGTSNEIFIEAKEGSTNSINEIKKEDCEESDRNSDAEFTSFELSDSNTQELIRVNNKKFRTKNTGSAKKEINFKEKYEYSDDEIPLAELCKERNMRFTKKTEKKRKKGRQKRRKETAADATAEVNQLNKRRTWTTAKHIPREGFSPRMVPETEEYVVIKLTREQVLSEMEERAVSNKYLRYLYKCDKCVKGFNFEDVLQNHTNRHIPKPGHIECDICHQFCPNAVSYRGHLKSHTTRYKCKICGDIRLSRQHLLEHHALNHTGVVKTYTCDDCSFTTTKRTVMQRHVRNHNNKDSHACDKCGKLFPNLNALRAHVSRHLSKLTACEQCGRKFISPSLLHKHVVSVHERRDFYCVECDVKFQSAYNLKLHLKRARRHRDDSSYKFKCPQCPRRYVYQSGVSSHLTSSHGEVSSHPCQMCEKRYATSHALRAHVRRNHGHEKQLEHNIAPGYEENREDERALTFLKN